MVQLISVANAANRVTAGRDRHPPRTSYGRFRPVRLRTWGPVKATPTVCEVLELDTHNVRKIADEDEVYNIPLVDSAGNRST